LKEDEPMSTSEPIRVTLELQEGYAFRVSFDDTALAPLLTDESPPLGSDQGPNPSRMLLAAIANCLAASLLFALRKFKNAPAKLHATISAVTERNTEGRWRIARAQVTLQLADAAAEYQQLPRILDQFEDFCIVTQSVRAGIDVQVVVRDGGGEVVFDQTGSTGPS